MAANKFMVIAVTDSLPRPDEAHRITTWLRGGEANRVHLRYPNIDIKKIHNILSHIPLELHSKLSLHDGVQLLKEFPGVGVHFNARNRHNADVINLEGRTVSYSCHSLAEVDEHADADYVFLSPIYNSISKAGYKSAFSLKDSGLMRTLAGHCVVALGGVTPDKFGELKSVGFAGAAMLGYFREDKPMLQFIPTAKTPEDIINQAIEAINGGCRWIQVRMKDASESAVEYVLDTLVPVCKDNGVTLIVDDHVKLAKKDGVHGVHLGQKDMPVKTAREILGPNKIIGLTINTLQQAQSVKNVPCDYFGVGPWRFTATKQNISPVLGADGVSEIIKELRDQGCKQPIVVIGSVGADDVKDILSLDTLHNTGIAVSGAITNSHNRTYATRRILNEIRPRSTICVNAEVADNQEHSGLCD